MNDTYLCPICNQITEGRCQDPDCRKLLAMHNEWARGGCYNRVLRRAIDVGAALKRKIVKQERELRGVEA